jgi:SAM-dependent methyltransferase
MKKSLIRVYGLLRMFGFDPRATINAFKSLPFYYRDLRIIKKQRQGDTTFAFNGNFPQLKERFSDAGNMKGHYFHQDLLVAKRVFENKPERHVDVGSRIDGFVAHVAVFRPIEILDIRPMQSKVKNISFRQADLMKLPEGMESYCDSISSLHAIEHFGLGRYGDPIDYDGHLKALDNIQKILKPGGHFYFSTPMGAQRIDFNAHRVFSLAYLTNLFEKNYVIEQFSYVNDKGDLFENVTVDEQNLKSSFNCYWGCAIFVLRKR